MESAAEPMSLPPIVIASVAGVVGAWLVRAGLGLVLRRSRARTAFLGLAGVVLVLSFATPFGGLSGAGWAEILVLEIMHVTTFIAAVVAVERATRPSGQSG